MKQIYFGAGSSNSGSGLKINAAVQNNYELNQDFEWPRMYPIVVETQKRAG